MASQGQAKRRCIRGGGRQEKTKFACIVDDLRNDLENITRFPKVLTDIVFRYIFTNPQDEQPQQMLEMLLVGGPKTLDYEGACDFRNAAPGVVKTQADTFRLAALSPDVPKSLLDCIGERYCLALKMQEFSNGKYFMNGFSRLQPFPEIAKPLWLQTVTTIPCCVLAYFCYKIVRMNNSSSNKRFHVCLSSDLVEQLESLSFLEGTWKYK